jgi:hypothetical protein
MLGRIRLIRGRLAAAIGVWKQGGPVSKAVRATASEWPAIVGLGSLLSQWSDDARVLDELKNNKLQSGQVDDSFLTIVLHSYNPQLGNSPLPNGRMVVKTFINHLKLEVLKAQLTVLGQP